MHVCTLSLPTVKRQLMYSWLILKTFFCFYFEWHSIFSFIFCCLDSVVPPPTLAPYLFPGFRLMSEKYTQTHTHTYPHSPFIERLVFYMVDLKYTEILSLAEAETLIPMSSPWFITTTFLLLERFELSFRDFKMLCKYHPLKIPHHPLKIPHHL